MMQIDKLRIKRIHPLFFGLILSTNSNLKLHRFDIHSTNSTRVVISLACSCNALYFYLSFYEHFMLR